MLTALINSNLWDCLDDLRWFFFLILLMLNALVEEVQVLGETQDGDKRGNIFGKIFLFNLGDLTGNGSIDTASDFIVETSYCLNCVQNGIFFSRDWC